MYHEDWVLESEIYSIKEKIQKLNKKAAKLGCPRIEFIDLKESKIVEEREEISGFVVHVWKYRKVAVSGEAPSYKGWQLIACIDHIDEKNANLVRTVPGAELPEKYRNNPQHCDHCGHNRYRKTTFVVLHDDGTYKQIGSACVKDFLGHPNPESFLWQAGWPKIFKDLLGGGGGKKDWEGYSLPSFMTVTAACIRIWGWTSRGKANEQGGYATADNVTAVINCKDKPPEGFEIIEDDRVLANKAIEFIKNMELPKNASDYEFNLKNIFDMDMVITRYAAIAASGLNYYLRKNEPKVEFKKSEFVGSVGEKITVTLKVLNIFWFEGAWGSVGVHKFVDENNNIFIWKTGFHHLNQGNMVTLKGTIKEHSVYNEKNQTVLTRCKMI